MSLDTSMKKDPHSQTKMAEGSVGVITRKVQKQASRAKEKPLKESEGRRLVTYFDASSALLRRAGFLWLRHLDLTWLMWLSVAMRPVEEERGAE
ncbi:unnamed protein product [Cyprideis torosa]|uniref:Uncharacterized protein n=1 Tax=Cyprideis torosa TaxID=163714 RepID=A0A7R8W2K2_9CRUS|nr:unnamed protein product [Cyprideis torosa]CAG0882042.1 unnamed protein product [Cyprideis torosa]